MDHKCIRKNQILQNPLILSTLYDDDLKQIRFLPSPTEVLLDRELLSNRVHALINVVCDGFLRSCNERIDRKFFPESFLMTCSAIPRSFIN